MTTEPMPAGPELDAMVSDLLGVDRAAWEDQCKQKGHEIEGDDWYCLNCRHYCGIGDPMPYSTDWAAAGEVLDRINVTEGWQMTRLFLDGECQVKIGGEKPVSVFGKTAPHAICLAFVAYMQHQKATN